MLDVLIMLKASLGGRETAWENAWIGGMSVNLSYIHMTSDSYQMFFVWCFQDCVDAQIQPFKKKSDPLEGSDKKRGTRCGTCTKADSILMLPQKQKKPTVYFFPSHSWPDLELFGVLQSKMRRIQYINY